MDNKSLNIEEIVKLIPHRYPILLVDRLLEYEASKYAIALKNVTINESFFLGHFPGRPLMPGVLIVEALAQTSAILVAKSDVGDPENKLVYFMSIDKVKFRNPVVPGDTIKLKVDVVQNRGSVWKFTGVARVEDKIVAEASFAAMMVDKEKEDDK